MDCQRRGGCIVSLLLYLALGAVLITLAMELFFKAPPCSLCFIQRLALLVGAYFMALALEGFYQKAMISVVAVLFFGAAVAARHSFIASCTKLACKLKLLGVCLPYWSLALFCLLLLASVLALLFFKRIMAEDQKKKLKLLAAISCLVAISCFYWRGWAF
jgi:disulfide bond formation protein DsbB